MSKAKQCPSSVGKKSAAKDRRPHERSAATGREFWRSLDDVADTQQFREFLEREFPAYASELRDPSRRQFLRIMGASLALAGAATIPACRRPDHKILPYNKLPEDVIPGKPLFYATSMPLPGGGAEGLLAETFEGRPTKLEGNPLHPINQGRTTAIAQASVLNLYDPDRLKSPSRMGDDGRENVGWSEFEQQASSLFRKYESNGGRGVFFLVDKKSSPSRDRMRDQILKRFPNARWLPYEPADDENAVEGARLAFGAPKRPEHSLDRAKVIVAIERDFFCGQNADVRESRGYAASRRVLETDERMSRLYAVETNMSLTGACADHRLRLRPAQVGAYVAALARAVFDRRGGDWAGSSIAEALKKSGAGVSPVQGSEDGRDARPTEKPFDPEWIDAVADDLVEHRGEAVIAVGPSQPAAVHALAHAINAAIGAIGQTVAYRPLEGDLAASSVESIRELSRAIDAGEVEALVTLNTNPVYNAPADLDYADKHRRVPTTIHLSVDEDETGAESTWRLNAAHWLETWSDVVAHDGTWSVVQPMIAPLFDGRSELWLLGLIAGQGERDPHEIVRATWREKAPGLTNLSDREFDKRWRRTLHDGLLANSAADAQTPSVRQNAVAEAVANLPDAGDSSGMDVLFMPDRTLGDGRHANNGWLQELPDPLTRCAWDNPALISAGTAEKLGVSDGQMIEVRVDGRSLKIPVWRQPGMADDAVVLALGYGRSACGRVGQGVGFNTYTARTTGALRSASGASIEPLRGEPVYPIACVQDHWTLEGRPIIREFDAPAFYKHGDEVVREKGPYGRDKELNFARRTGHISHAPRPDNIFLPEQEQTYETRPQWGMSIDLTTCTGCGACTVACQAENNIPIVGKSEVMNGREMHWIRVDRYYASPQFEPMKGVSSEAGPFTGGRNADDVEATFQPLPCVHCENAPCEPVCPVNATTHGPEGLNQMAYNRCIGTRYCMNNCPYKVRRFNFFDYGTKRLHGDYVGKEWLGGLFPNEQWAPPRLREDIDQGAGEVNAMQYNPHVTVRERGVMEKCTYCVQRINAARVETKLQDLDHIPDGFFEVACQQACPTDSIVFGDIQDSLSKVRRLRDNARAYMVLETLNTRPRTTHMARIRNPNPRLREPEEDPFHGHGGGDHAEPTQQHHDEGHVMSLPVMGQPGGGTHA